MNDVKLINMAQHSKLPASTLKLIKTDIELASKNNVQATPAFPKQMMIELNNSCNHKCIFCSYQKMTRPKGVIKQELAHKILREAAELGVKKIMFYTTGEPLLCKELPEYLLLANKLGIKDLVICTNGSLAEPDLMKKLVANGLNEVIFSINAFRKDTYALIHGKDDLVNVKKHLKWLVDLKRKNDLPLKISINFTVTKNNINELDDFDAYYKALVDNINYRQVGDQFGNMVAELKELLPLELKKTPFPTPCRLPFERIHINKEGYLTLCCVDYQNFLTVADLNMQSLREAWHNELMLTLRKKHLSGDLKGTMCYNCINSCSDKIAPLIKEHASAFKR